MKVEWNQRAVKIAAVVYFVLLLPPVRHLLEASMTSQMLIQIPLLVGVGCSLRGVMPSRWSALIDGWNRLGITGLLLATLTGVCWLLPRSLDAAIAEPFATLAKYLSLPVLLGLPFALSWPRMNFTVRGLFMVELIATCFRMGWLYEVSPERLCNRYLLGDQQRLGEYMLIIGAALLLWVTGKLIWGRFSSLC